MQSLENNIFYLNMFFLWAQINPVVGAPLTPNKQQTSIWFLSIY